MRRTGYAIGPPGGSRSPNAIVCEPQRYRARQARRVSRGRDPHRPPSREIFWTYPNATAKVSSDTSEQVDQALPSRGIMNTAARIIDFIWPLLVATSCIYFWAAFCYLFFRFAQPETEARLRRFLQQHHSFYTHSSFSGSSLSVTARVMKKAGSRGWCMMALPAISMGSGFSYGRFLMCNGVLFVGGLMLAYAWYGIRCLRILGLESYTKQDA
jgi:hypothetical protein